MRRSDDNSCVPRPHDNVAGLGLRNTEKSFKSVVKIVGTCVDVGKPGALVNGVNQMRAVVGGITPHFGVECGSNDGQTFILSQRTFGLSRRLRTHPTGTTGSLERLLRRQTFIVSQRAVGLARRLRRRATGTPGSLERLLRRQAFVLSQRAFGLSRRRRRHGAGSTRLWKRLLRRGDAQSDPTNQHHDRGFHKKPHPLF